MTILVTGSRGSVAKTLIGLLQRQGLDVRAASADPDRLDLPTGTPTVRCDLTDAATFPRALDGIASVFLYAEPSTAHTFAAQALRAGVRHIVLLSSAAVTVPDAETNPLAKSHLDAERALASSPITSTVLRPGSFAGNALQWSLPIRTAGAVNLPYPGSHTDPIHEKDIAEAAFAVLTDPDPAGAVHTLSGPQSLTFRQQIEHIARATGRPIAVGAVDREVWKKEMAAYVPADFADVLLDFWRSSDGSPVAITPTVEELTGHPARTFAQWAAEHAGDFTDRDPAGR